MECHEEAGQATPPQGPASDDTSARLRSLELRVGELLRLVREAAPTPAAGQPGNSAGSPAHSDCIPGCLVEDPSLRVLLLPGVRQGQLCFELKELACHARRALSSAAPSWHPEDAVLEELKRGTLRGMVVHALPGRANPVWVTRGPPVQEIGKAAMDTESSHVFLSPVFREASWPLVEAALHWCRRERAAPTIDLVHQVVARLLETQNRFTKLDLFALIREAPEGLEPSVIAAADSEVQISTNVHMLPHPNFHAGEPALPIFTIGDEELATTDAAHGFPRGSRQGSRQGSDFAPLVDVYQALSPLLDKVRAICGDLPFPDTLAVLRCAAVVPQLRIPDVVASASGGALLWASKCAVQLGVSSAGPCASRLGASAVVLEHDLQDGLGHDDASMTGTVPETLLAILGTDDLGRPRSADSLRAKALFIKCFQQDLYHRRTLPLSQLNNLYMMRCGMQLPYKVAGYQKLRVFLLDIPGLGVVGKANAMQLVLEDSAKLAEFRNMLPAALSQLATMPSQLPTGPHSPLAGNACKPRGSSVTPGVAPGFQVPYLDEAPLGDWSGLPETRAISLGPSPPLSGAVRSQSWEPGLVQNCRQPEDASPVKLSLDSIIENISTDLGLPETPLGTCCQLPETRAGALEQPSLLPGGVRAQCREPAPVQRGHLPEGALEQPSLLSGGVRAQSREPAPVQRGRLPEGHAVCLNLYRGLGLAEMPGGARARGREPAPVERSRPPQDASPTKVAIDSSFQDLYQDLGLSELQSGRPRASASPTPLDVDSRFQGLFTDVGLPKVPDVSNVPANGPARIGISTGVLGKRKTARFDGVSKAAYFFSSPGAVSSADRDASTEQGKYDMGTLLHAQLSAATPCLIYNIFSGEVMLTNHLCEELFESKISSGRSQLTQCYVQNLVCDSDKARFISACMDYVIVSGQQHAMLQDVRISTMCGSELHVNVRAARLVEMWWRLDFF